VYLLDTDVFTLAYTRRSLIPPLEARISATRQDQLYLSVITVRESLKGALGLISRKEQTADIVGAYNLLKLVLEATSKFYIVQFDQDCYNMFQTIPVNIRNRHPQDSRIAALALRHSMIIVTRNLHHFEDIPNLQCEDWTRPESRWFAKQGTCSRSAHIQIAGNTEWDATAGFC
jgi:tRNA(fMet)-specific endonuclease VapC